MNRDYEFLEGMCMEHGASIEKAFARAVAHFYELHRANLLAIRPATKASLINDFAYQFLQEELDGTAGFEFLSRRKARYIGCGGRILIRIKKLDEASRPTINKTLAATRFNTQNDMDLFGGARAVNVYLGYILSEESGEINKVAFACPNTDGMIAWTLDVGGRHVQKALDFEVARRSPKTDRLVSKKQRKKAGQA